MISLFEYGIWQPVSDRAALEERLLTVWNDLLEYDAENQNNEQQRQLRNQPFLQFDGSNIRARNFVGFIQHAEQTIEIYPKVFRERFDEVKEHDKALMLRHTFFWFSYCRKWKFPFNTASLDTLQVDSFPELIIHLIAGQFLQVLSEQPLAMYQSVSETLQSPKGSINFKRYLNNGVSRGLYASIECDHEPFLFNNSVNRLLKYCARVLLNQTKFPETLRVLQEVLFILDEVEDVSCTLHDVTAVRINPFFENYLLLMDHCHLILSGQLYSGRSDDLSQWCLLFPMEYIFEDFVAGFLEAHFSAEWKVEYQKSDQYLCDHPKVFNMQHDIFLTSRKDTCVKLIIDTKYKLRDNDFKKDPKRGIAQADLYQMVSYAFRRGCTDIVLIYPNIKEVLNEVDDFEIFSGFPGQDKISVTASEIPFTSLLDLKSLESRLKKHFSTILNTFH